MQQAYFLADEAFPTFTNPYEPLGELFQTPELGTMNYVFVIIMALIFAFLVFLFFSWHMATFYVDGKVFINIAQPFMREIHPPVPKKDGYRFLCWCWDTELEEPATMPYHIKLFNVTFYAKFEAIAGEEAVGGTDTPGDASALPHTDALDGEHLVVAPLRHRHEPVVLPPIDGDSHPLDRSPDSQE